VSIVYTLLVAHMVGDFICQSDWMATHKATRWDALALHVATYMVVLLACLVVVYARDVPVLPYLDSIGVFASVNAAAHFVQDAITSRINARLWQANQRHWFFVGIGADQLLHYVTLFVTAGWWLT
jgi:hypothetical protein